MAHGGLELERPETSLLGAQRMEEMSSNFSNGD